MKKQKIRDKLIALNTLQLLTNLNIDTNAVVDNIKLKLFQPLFAIKFKNYIFNITIYSFFQNPK